MAQGEADAKGIGRDVTGGSGKRLERAAGIEPAPEAWKAHVQIRDFSPKSNHQAD
jgi:hypothetical protein